MKNRVLNDPTISLFGIDSKIEIRILKKHSAFPHLLEHYFQYSRGGNSLNIHQQMSRFKNAYRGILSNLKKGNHAI